MVYNVYYYTHFVDVPHLMPIPAGNTRLLLKLSSAYFLLCGATAILWPSSWYFVAGITEYSWNLPLAIVGAMMLGLSAASFFAQARPEESAAIIIGLIVANLIDALIVAYYTFVGPLPLFNGIAFICLDTGWVYALVRVFPRSAT